MKLQNHRHLPIPFCFTLLAILLGPHSLFAQGAAFSTNLTELRAESYGKSSTGPLDRCPDGCHIMESNHWWVGLPSLPGQRSSLVVIGDISKCTSQLSKDKSTIFTECMLKIGKILQDRTEKDIVPGSIVTITREGGSVSVDGKEMSVSIDGQRLPSINKHCAFFLEYRSLTDDYTILTFYGLTEHGVEAADLPRHFHLHDGKSLDTFLNEVDSSTWDEGPYLPLHSGGAQ